MAATTEGNRLTEDQRQKMCRGKKRFRREGDAIFAAARAMAEAPGRWRRVYRCPVCAGYHIAHEELRAA